MEQSDEYKIEKSIPLPKRATKYPLEKMEVGDSFLINKYKHHNFTYANKWAIKYQPEWKFYSSREGEGVRVWRIK
jgi:hypothetical protein